MGPIPLPINTNPQDLTSRCEADEAVPTERREHPLRVSRIIKPYLSLSPLRVHQKKHWSHETINNLQVNNVQKPLLLVLPKNVTWFSYYPSFWGRIITNKILSGYLPGGSIRNLVLHPFIGTEVTENFTQQKRWKGTWLPPSPKRAICSQNCQVLRIFQRSCGCFQK